VAATDDGVYMENNRSWSIDDKRLNFQFGCEIGWEVKNGRLGRMLRNPTYTGIGPRFWRSMDMLSGEIVTWGTPNCGKGQPGRTAAASGLCPPDPGWPGLAPPSPVDEPVAVDEDVIAATPADRAARVRAFVDACAGLPAAGYCRTAHGTSAFANSAGQSALGA